MPLRSTDSNQHVHQLVADADRIFIFFEEVLNESIFRFSVVGIIAFLVQRLLHEVVRILLDNLAGSSILCWGIDPVEIRKANSCCTYQGSIIKTLSKRMLGVGLIILDRLAEDQISRGGEGKTVKEGLEINNTGGAPEVLDQIVQRFAEFCQILIMHLGERTSKHFPRVLPLSSVLSKDAFAQEGPQSITAGSQPVIYELASVGFAFHAWEEQCTFEIGRDDGFDILGIKG